MVNPREMPEDVRRLLTAQLAPETERWWMTWAEQLQNEAKEKGREEERVRLLAKIRQRTLAMLRLQFGTLPDALIQRLEEASEEELDRIAERIPTAGSLGEVLG
jgi:predicted signal transduction protein with EAL and GGDEF domain